MDNKWWSRALMIVALIVLSVGTFQVVPTRAQDAIPWPTAGWQTSTPEAQGIDSARLARLFEQIESGNHNIHSVVIVRHGVLVAEAYRAPHTPDTLHHIMSCTKSFTSALIGIAIAQGAIQGVDQRVLDFFPDRTPANLDAAKRNMTLENLLTMSGGFEWPGGMLEDPSLDELWRSEDWVQFMLDRPLSDPPGSRFVYNTGGSHLLSAILQQATGLTEAAFAREALFTPLGITDWRWQTDPQGINTGGWGLRITPRDMAKFGYLYLHGGQWDGQQVIPAEWVADSTRAQITTGVQGMPASYGYQWWIEGEAFAALGYGGQHIIVLPDRDMVVIFTSGLPTTSWAVPQMLLTTYILPASASSDPLPANPEGNAVLQAAIDALEHPAAEAVPPLPDTARAISGQTYTLEANDFGLTSLSLTFTDGADTALLTLNGTLALPVGLDGVLRSSESEGQTLFDAPLALRGAWQRSGAFSVDLCLVGEVENYTVNLNFSGEDVAFHWFENASLQTGSFRGTRS